MGAVVGGGWRGTVPARQADNYLAYLEATGLQDYRATPGNQGMQVLRRIAGDEAEFVPTSLWDSLMRSVPSRAMTTSAVYIPPTKISCSRSRRTSITSRSSCRAEQFQDDQRSKSQRKQRMAKVRPKDPSIASQKGYSRPAPCRTAGNAAPKVSIT